MAVELCDQDTPTALPDYLQRAGGLVWAKLKGYPFWPAVLVDDEHSAAAHWKWAPRSATRALCHVLFPDDGRRAWLSQADLLPYDGRQQYEQHAAAQLAAAAAKARTERQRVQSRYAPANGRNERALRAAVEAADALAAVHDLAERIERAKEAHRPKERKAKGSATNESAATQSVPKLRISLPHTTSAAYVVRYPGETAAPKTKAAKTKQRASLPPHLVPEATVTRRAAKRPRQSDNDATGVVGPKSLAHVTSNASVLANQSYYAGACKRARIVLKSGTERTSPVAKAKFAVRVPSHLLRNRVNNRSIKMTLDGKKAALHRVLEPIASSSGRTGGGARRHSLDGRAAVDHAYRKIAPRPRRSSPANVAHLQHTAEEIVRPNEASSSASPSMSASSSPPDEKRSKLMGCIDKIAARVKGGTAAVKAAAAASISDDDDTAVVECLPAVPACYACCRSFHNGDDDEEKGDIEVAVVCAGGCDRTFHRDCVRRRGEQDGFVCDQCDAGQHTHRCVVCGACGTADRPTVRCAHAAGCLHHFHPACAGEYKPSDRTPEKSSPWKGYVGAAAGPRCPAHVCNTCLLAAGKTARAFKGAILQCMKCPVAYHVKDSCLPAGVEFINDRLLICPVHTDEKSAACRPMRVNVDYCFDCGKGGTLVCCERCPAAIHEHCLPDGVRAQLAADEFVCAACQAGRHPMFRDLVWVKYGAYRWWPALVLDPLDTPVNLQRRRHSVGEFCVRFLGTGDYAWVSRGRCFAYQEADTAGALHSTSGKTAKGTDKQFAKAVGEAKRILSERKTRAALAEAEKTATVSNVAPKYDELKCNRPAGSGLVKGRPLEERHPSCGCAARAANGGSPATSAARPCADDHTCANRATQIECLTGSCMSSGGDCGNQRFQRRQTARVLPFLTGSRGWGLKTLVDIDKGDFIAEYMGELIDQAEFRRRWQRKLATQNKDFYFLSLDNDRIIDAEYAGSPARYMNHSCAPNCETRTWHVAGDTRVGVFALRRIGVGEELTFHYNFDSLDAEVKMQCNCGSEHCDGSIGKKKVIKAASNGASQQQQRPKRRPAFRHENECFRCGEGGQLVCCTKKHCPKVYHLECLNEAQVPKGQWHCPWHYCDACSRRSAVHCRTCDCSWCAQHAAELPAGKRADSEGMLVCDDCKGERAHDQ